MAWKLDVHSRVCRRVRARVNSLADWLVHFLANALFLAKAPGLAIRHFMAAASLVCFSVLLFSTKAQADEIDVDVELILAVDVSYSMDPEEQRLQREGYIQALNSPDILNAIKKGIHGKIAVAYIEWAGAQSRELAADWHVIDSAESAAAFTEKLIEKPVKRWARTSISGAIDFSVPLFSSNQFNGLKQVIDISGDGSNNHGRPVERARDDALAAGIVINGLPIMFNRPTGGYRDVEPLDLYYTECVIGGPGSFVIPIRTREQFIDAIRTKILLEIALIPQEHHWIQKAQTQDKRVDCMIGERLWRERWENN